MQRWERAKFLGLNPPTTVWDLLLKCNKDPFVMYRSVYYVSTLFSPLCFVLFLKKLSIRKNVMKNIMDY